MLWKSWGGETRPSKGSGRVEEINAGAAVCSLLTAANVAARMVGDTDGRTQPAKGTEPGS